MVDMRIETRSDTARQVEEQYEKIADFMALNRDIRNVMRAMQNEITIHFPVRADDGRIVMLTGYRVQHNNVLGPYFGGIRYQAGLSLDDMRVLAFLRTWKNALAGIPAGSAMGGVDLDPAVLSPEETERVTRRFVFSLGANIGADYDILGPGLNTDSQIMAWAFDTLQLSMPPDERNRFTHAVTGKPLHLGGSACSDCAGGLTVALLIRWWARRNSLPLEGLRVAVQGLGNTGFWAARSLYEDRVRLVALGDATGTVHDEKGVCIHDLSRHLRTHRGVKKYPGGETGESERFWEIPSDVCILAARENQLTAIRAGGLKARLVVEGVDGAVTPEAGSLLDDGETEIFPDILANTGSAIVQYLEWLQNKRSESWDRTVVEEKLVRKVDDIVGRVDGVRREFGCDWRTAAWITAVSRLDHVIRERGVFP